MIYPYHRYLCYQAVNGDDVDDIVRHMSELSYIPPAREDVEEICDRFAGRRVTSKIREEYGISFFDEAAFKSVSLIVQDLGARTAAERLLINRVSARHIATIVGMKYNISVSARAVELFRDGFWDTLNLSATQFREYFSSGGVGHVKPPPRAVSLATRPVYSAWREGLYPEDEELPVDVMLREMQVDAFLSFKEKLSQDDRLGAASYAQLVLKSTPVRAEFLGRKKADPNDLKAVLHYPKTSLATLADLHTEYSQMTAGTGAVAQAMDGSDK